MSESSSLRNSGSMNGSNLAEPIHLQHLYKSLQLEPFLDYVESFISQPISDSDSLSEDEDDGELQLLRTELTALERASSLYNFNNIQKKRRWVCDALCHSSDSDSDSCSEAHPLDLNPSSKRNIEDCSYDDRLSSSINQPTSNSLNLEVGNILLQNGKNRSLPSQPGIVKGTSHNVGKNFDSDQEDDGDTTENSDEDTEEEDDAQDGDQEESTEKLDLPQEDESVSSVERNLQSSSGTVTQESRKQLRISAMLREHLVRKSHADTYFSQSWQQKDVSSDPSGESGSHKGHNFLYYGAGLLCNVDRYSDHQRYLTVSRRARGSGTSRATRGGAPNGSVPSGGCTGVSFNGSQPDHRRGSQGSFGLESVIKEEDDDDGYDINSENMLGMADDGEDSLVDEDISRIRTRLPHRKEKKGKKPDAQALAMRRHKLWLLMARKEVVRSQRTRAATHKEMLHNCKKVANAATKTYRQKALQSQKVVKEKVWLLKRLSRSMQNEWRKFDRIVKEQNKRAEKEAEEQRKMDKEIMEAKRQQRKVNFLITLPELYAHFMRGKLSGRADDASSASILKQLEDGQQSAAGVDGAPSAAITDEDYDCEAMKLQALQTAQEAVRSQRSLMSKYNKRSAAEAVAVASGDDQEAGGSREKEFRQPDIFMGQLKSYQLKGMNWIANLYYFGINGILADEMGLGKTVQAIAFLAHICEEYDSWGPFLIVTPASTLHNWTAELNRFVPDFKVVPYWGTPEERKSLRKFFDVRNCGDRTESSFHVAVTSYHIVIQDFKFLNRLKWNYMVLDEAQAIKSINSQRWKLLLGFSCRNRLLLSGTPIQNTMAELWALLHFIMPALFDSHQWFNEWFSKDIEGHVENRTHVDEKHLNRLHTILKPFMLRRIKTEVENELTDKIEIMVYCPLTLRQKFLYSGLRNKISIEELLHSTSGSATAPAAVTNSLMNLVMQFRKVCNHPELLERREVQSPLWCASCMLLVPRLVYHMVLDSEQRSLLPLSLFMPDHVHSRLYSETKDSNTWATSWWFASLCGVSVAEACLILKQEVCAVWSALHRYHHYQLPLAHHRQLWHHSINQLEDPTTISSGNRTSIQALGGSLATWNLGNDNLLLPGNDYSSETLQGLKFCSHSSSFYTFANHTIHSIPETSSHRRMRLNKLHKTQIEEISSTVFVKSETNDASPECPMDEISQHHKDDKTTLSSPRSVSDASSSHAPRSSSPKKSISISPKKSLRLKSPSKTVVTTRSIPSRPSEVGDTEEEYGPSHPFLPRPPITRPCQPTLLPLFLTHACPKVMCGSRHLYSYDQHACECAGPGRPSGEMRMLRCGVTQALQCEAERTRDLVTNPYCQLQEPHRAGLDAFSPQTGADWNHVIIPDKHSLMMDAGKLFVLDSLLSRMKAAGNRVLIYSQMTKMINLLEDYMRHRHHKYMRLDGSSKISERRDMVADFQSKSDIFVFLLSTRAGGVGINLTAADTVIFYDSDWNPTVDQQAMDRAHRVGQTKQVTVYRLICKGTIEERILQRAKEKSEIQRMVISGGSFKPDTLKPKEVVSLLLDDDIEQQFRARQEERRALDEQRVEYNREKMRKRYAEKKLEREQQEVKKRRLEEEGAETSTSPPPQPLSANTDMDEVSASASCSRDEASDQQQQQRCVSETASSLADSVSTESSSSSNTVSSGLRSGSALSGTTVRGHRKRGRPRMSGVRGRAGAMSRPVPGPSSGADGSLSNPPVTVKRGRGRPRLLPLGPGHQGQRPLQQLPAALGALQPRSHDGYQ
ncbi:DBINO domain [Trinorchestia longiramus]|nr:DBINO domain [Trinorchestia longiramus]